MRRATSRCGFVGGAGLLQPFTRIGSDNCGLVHPIVWRGGGSSSFHLRHCPGGVRLLRTLAVRIGAGNGRNEEVVGVCCGLGAWSAGCVQWWRGSGGGCALASHGCVSVVDGVGTGERGGSVATGLLCVRAGFGAIWALLSGGVAVLGPVGCRALCRRHCACVGHGRVVSHREVV